MAKITEVDFKCIRLIEHFECSGNVNSPKWLHAAPDTGGVWTIGIGTTRYFGGAKVQKGDIITVEKAYQLLQFDLKDAMRRINELTDAPLNQYQFDALVSFGYNVGTEENGFETSTLRKVINANPNDFAAITAEFVKWKYDNHVFEPGLLRRRKSEAWLYQYGELNFFE